jgi:hypothetical protein
MPMPSETNSASHDPAPSWRVVLRCATETDRPPSRQKVDPDTAIPCYKRHRSRTMRPTASIGKRIRARCEPSNRRGQAAGGFGCRGVRRSEVTRQHDHRIPASDWFTPQPRMHRSSTPKAPAPAPPRQNQRCPARRRGRGRPNRGPLPRSVRPAEQIPTDPDPKASQGTGHHATNLHIGYALCRASFNPVQDGSRQPSGQMIS